MSNEQDLNFYRQRDLAFDGIIRTVEELAKQESPALVSSFDELSAESLASSSRREVLTLFLRGIRYLKNGAPGGQPGSLAEALSRISLRSSGLAASAGVKPPQFEPVYCSVAYTDGYEAAIFLCQWLIGAAAGDRVKSQQEIQLKLSISTPASAFGVASELDDPALKQIFDAVRSSESIIVATPKAPLPPGISEQDMTALRRQMVFSLNVLADTYEKTCREFQALLKSQPERLFGPPPAKPRGDTFDI